MNPVLRKDLLGLLRLTRAAATQIAFVAVLGVVVLVSWPQGGVMGGTIQFGQTAQPAAQDQLLLGLVLGQLVLLVLFVPGIAAVALTAEREANTLEMLYASRLTPAQIIGGKVGLAVSYPLLLLVSGLPFVALLSWRGDVRPGDLLWSYAIVVAAAVMLAMLSLMVSALCRQSATALVLAYAVALVLCGGMLVPAAIVLESQSGPIAALLHYARAASPVAAALSLLRPEINDLGGASHGMQPVWQVYLAVAASIAMACFAVVAAKLKRPPASSEAMGAMGAMGSEQAQQSALRKVLVLIDPNKTRRPIGRGNALIAKERRTSNLRSARWMIRIFYGSLFASLGLAIMALYSGAEHADLLRYVVQVLVAFQFALVGLVVPSLTSAAISSELESGTFEVLRLAPLGAGRLFWGKFIPALIPAMLPLVALLPAYGTMCLLEPEYVVRLGHMLPIALLAVVFCCILGLTCSACTANTARATVSAYLVTAALFVLPMGAWWAQSVQISMRAARWLALPSPLVVAMSGFAPGSSVSAEIANLRTEHLWLMGSLCVGMLVVVRARLGMLLHKG